MNLFAYISVTNRITLRRLAWPLCQEKEEEKNGHMTCDIWHVTCDSWHVTGSEVVLNMFSKRITEFINELLNGICLCRSVLATPGLSNMKFTNYSYSYSYISWFCKSTPTPIWGEITIRWTLHFLSQTIRATRIPFYYKIVSLGLRPARTLLKRLTNKIWILTHNLNLFLDLQGTCD